MPFQRQRPLLVLTEDIRDQLDTISRSRTEPVHRVERAKMLLSYAEGSTISSIARAMNTNRPKVERCVDKALQLGALMSTRVRRSWWRCRIFRAVVGPGRFLRKSRAWVVALACQKPKDLGYPEELWTTRLLAEHVRRHCHAAGHPRLSKLARGTVSKILSQRAEISSSQGGVLPRKTGMKR